MRRETQIRYAKRFSGGPPPDKVLIMGATSEEGFSPYVMRHQAEGETSLLAFTTERKLSRGIVEFWPKGDRRRLTRSGWFPGGVSFSFEEATRKAYDSGLDFVGIDMGGGGKYSRVFYVGIAGLDEARHLDKQARDIERMERGS